MKNTAALFVITMIFNVIIIGIFVYLTNYRIFNNIELYDKKGNIIMKLGSIDDTTSGIICFDKSKRKRFTIYTIDGEETEFGLYDQAGRIRTRISASEDGKSTIQVISDESYISTESDGGLGPSISFRRNDGKASMQLFSTHEGEKGFSLYGKNDLIKMVVSLNKDDEPGAGFFDSEGRGRMGFGVKQDGSAGFEFQDSNGKQRLSMGLYDNGNSYIDLRGVNGLGRTILHEQLISMSDMKGTPRVGLVVDPNSWAGLTLLPSDGRGRLCLGAGQDSHKEIFIDGMNEDRILEFNSEDWESGRGKVPEANGNKIFLTPFRSRIYAPGVVIPTAPSR